MASDARCPKADRALDSDTVVTRLFYAKAYAAAHRYMRDRFRMDFNFKLAGCSRFQRNRRGQADATLRDVDRLGIEGDPWIARH